MPLINDRIRITHGKPFRLKDHGTALKKGPGKDELKAMLATDREKIVELQERLFAERKHTLLLIFQAMDAAGKDSCIGHLLTGVNPQGCSVTSFKQPSSEELAHDFLWRHAKAVPERGMIGVHNRSHYEEVLVVNVHPEYLLAQHLPDVNTPADATKGFWKKRYESIRSWEQHLSDSGVTVMKFYLHMSPKEQKKRFLERIEDERKNWKFSSGDVKERVLFDRYMTAYQDAIAATAAPHAPWFVVPADEQWETRAIVARLVREELERLKPAFPKLDAKAKADLLLAAKNLKAE